MKATAHWCTAKSGERVPSFNVLVLLLLLSESVCEVQDLAEKTNWFTMCGMNTCGWRVGWLH